MPRSGIAAIDVEMRRAVLLRIRKSIVAIGLVLTVFGVGAVQARQAGPAIRSNSAIVVDADSKTVLFERQPHTAVPIASITKLMTALIVLQARLPLDETIAITDDDRRSVRGPSRLVVGAVLTRRDLLHLALMSSENRAAHALSRAYPGGTRAFIAAMNAKADALGMHSAHFDDPTGLSAENVASPTDLAKLVEAAAAVPLIREFSTDDEYSVRVRRHDVTFRNTDYLVRRGDWDIDLQKTGFTNHAGRCLVMKTVINGRNMVIVLLDSFGKYTRTADARRIKKWLEARASVAVRELT